VIHEKGFLYFRNTRIFLTISAELSGSSIICAQLGAPRAASTRTLLGDHHQRAMLQFYDNAAIRRSSRRANAAGWPQG
jgi:hypothetical protein